MLHEAVQLLQHCRAFVEGRMAAGHVRKCASRYGLARVLCRAEPLVRCAEGTVSGQSFIITFGIWV
jgi:hypothetical protein